MVTTGDAAPDFDAPLAGGTAYNDVEPFTLSAAIGNGPIVLAFFPAAFTSGCTTEMCTFSEALPQFADLNAQVYGISVDLPFAQNVWMAQEDIGVPMLSDWNHDIIHAYDVVLPAMYDLVEAAQRAVFVIDDDGIVTYAWVRDGANPDFDELVAEVHAAVEAAA